MKQITCFLSQGTFDDTKQTIAEFRKSAAVSKIVLVCKEQPTEPFEGAEILVAGSLVSTKTVKKIAEISRMVALIPHNAYISTVLVNVAYYIHCACFTVQNVHRLT